MEIAYFIVYILLLYFYTLYYLKLNHKLLSIIENKDAKAFDLFASLHSLLFMVSTFIIQLYNYIFFYVFMNKYGGDWKYIIPVGTICLILLIVFTITGYKRKKDILNKYNERYGFELPFYRQIEYISLYRHTCLIVNSILLINILAMII